MRSWKQAAVLAAIGLAFTGTAFAKEAGDWIVRAGVTHIAPKSDNGSLDADPSIGLDVGSATMFTFDGTRMISDSWAIELLAALPFKHDVDATGLGEVATVKHLPPTLSAQYHFNAAGKVSPYAGAGVNWTIFFDEKPKGALVDLGVEDLKLTNSLGFAAVLGIDVALTENMLLNANVRWMNIETDVKADGTKIAKAKIDPWIYSLNIGWRF